MRRLVDQLGVYNPLMRCEESQDYGRVCVETLHSSIKRLKKTLRNWKGFDEERKEISEVE